MPETTCLVQWWCSSFLEYVGICSSPHIEEDRLWIVTNRGEVVCLDMNGLADGNDGDFKDEQKYYGAGFAGMAKARDVTVDGETRTLSEASAKLVESLMGRKPELRFAYIQEHAKFVQDIDI